MKQAIIGLCLFTMALTVYAAAIRDDVNIAGEKTRTSYAFGMTVGEELKQAGIELHYSSFMEGLKSAMEEGQTTLMEREEALEIVQDAFESAFRRRSAELQIMEELFLAGNAARTGITTTASGLQYETIEEGNGPRPVAGDTVLVHYTGAFTDGSVFDSSYDRGEPEEIPLGMVIPGWTEGLQLMNVGGKYRMYIPSSLAYGEFGAGQVIPPYATLVFTIDLLEIMQGNGDE
jgi:FKBP-type peptidyl-prolyl cis-trans isomerase